MTLSIACQCGQFQGELDPQLARRHNRLCCYCNDCQAFAHYLGNTENILDKRGGTDITQVTASTVTITAGKEHLACVRLSPKGLRRWYAKCCDTPIGNAPSASLPFIGLIHSFLTPHPAIDETFGPIRLVAFTKFATGAEKPIPRGLIGGIVRMVWIILLSKLHGDAKHHPFFDGVTGQPLVEPIVKTP